jgi:RNA polymerase sigma-70 factor (ECF subfamily)
MSDEEVAEVCNGAVGTVKSRVNRARSKLAFLLDLTSEAELGPDNVTKAALAAEETAAPTPVMVTLACSG